MTENTPREVLPGITFEDDPDIVTTHPEKNDAARSFWRETRSLVRDVLFAALTAILIVVFVIQPVKVEGTSMLPRLHDGERIFVNKFLYQLDGWPTKSLSLGRAIRQGDIVVFWYPKDPSKSFIKRVIGVPGDHVRIDTDGGVFINGKQLSEPYLSTEFTSMHQRQLDEVVPEHHYFVMGDNRDHSNDSRAWGFVPEKYIYGQACFRYWPLNEMGLLVE